MARPLTFFALHPTRDIVVDVPEYRPGEVQRAREWLAYFGGKALNAARTAGRLGASAEAVILAPPAWRPALRAFLAPDRVRGRVIPVAGEGRVCVVLREHGREAVVNTDLKLPFTARHLAALARAVRRAAARDGFVVLAGSLPPTLTARQARTLTALAAGGRARLALDQTGARLRAGLRHRPWIIKPNLPEFRALTGSRATAVTDLARAARDVLARGAGRVLLSLGARGCLLVGPAAAWFAPPVPVRLAAPSPLGCGDALFGAFLGAVAAGADEADALAAGVAAATANLFHSGACFFSAAEAARWRSKVRVTRVA